ncbi:hypothetical protein CPB84DRAFT_1857179 [Gymnopilus junonius]|uniref:DUF6532 domain-containing protein n=1 Tax=Gymnopilus junonius TaxID=109634 RepID=A0A9P5TFC5_GYMJU|nr:hypothetical protein CPB84DRAFT_1857179 [Gymnopilus junonius]
MEQEGDDDDADTSGPPAKRMRTQTITLDPEELEMAGGLCPIHSSTTNRNDADNDETGSQDGGTDDLQSDQEYDFEDGDMANTGFEDNGMMFEADDSRSTTPFSQRSRSSTPASHSGATKSSNSSKVTEGDFTPKTRHLAISSKSHVRMTSIYNPHGPFLPHSRVARIDFAWNTVKEASKISNDPSFKDALSHASKDYNTKKKSQLLSNVISKACERVRGFFGLNGIQDKVRDDVQWLLTESRFMYGEVDIVKCTYNKKKPFGSDLILEVVESQWFSSSSRSNADVETTTKIAEDREVPLSMVLLAITVEPSINIGYSYAHHLGNWKTLVKNAPSFAKFFMNDLCDRLLSSQSDFFDDADQGKDLASLDFAALNQLGEDWEAKEAELAKAGDETPAEEAAAPADVTAD